MKVHTQLTKNENRKRTNIKLQFILAVVFALMLVVASSAYAKQSAGVLLQSGLYQEEVQGDLDAAIKVYERVLKDFPRNRPVAAKAQLHIGLCYEKLGLKEAQRAYQKVVDSYPEQAEAVKVANEKLQVLIRAQEVIQKGGREFALRKIRHEWGGFASISTDGKYMCDMDWDTGDLAVYEIATGKKRRLTNKGSWEDSSEYALDSAISPDSKEVAYLWYDHKTKASSLHAIGLDGSGDRLLCKGKYAMPRDWSADGSKILTVLYEATNEMVWISASDGSIRRITSMGKGYPGKFDVSPDGRFIAYDRPQAKNTSKRDIFVFDLSEDREIPVVKHPDDDRLLGWTPDGKSIFFSSNRTGTWDGWLLQAATGEPQGFPKLVKQGIGDVTPIGFTQSSSYYYRNEQTLRDVVVATLDLETGKVLSPPMPVRQTGATTCHDWSPDGQYLAYCTQRPDKTQRIYIRTLATGQERMLADNLPYIRWLRWSLDGKSILIDRFKRGDSQGVIFKIDVQTGERTDLVRSETEVLLKPEVSPDGKTLFYGRGDPVSKTARLVARDLQSGREKELFRNVPPARVTGSALSPDGQRFVLSIIPSPTRPAAPVLKILSAAGGEPRELIQFDKSEKLAGVGVAWMPDSQDVLFWKWFRVRGGKELELWRISAEGGEPRKLWAWKTLGHLRVHPDGQRIAFNSRSKTSEVWVMENFLPESTAGE